MIIPNEKEPKLQRGKKIFTEDELKKKTLHRIHAILYKLTEKQVGSKSP